MSLTILSRKLDQLNDKEKRLKLTYDVRGTNKYQHRYIKDLKDDFKEDLQLRFGNKPYGLGWNQDSEHGSEHADEDDVEVEEVVDEEEQEIKEETNDMMSPQTALSNFRPTSGKPITPYAGHDRPFSASTGRPMTASSAGRGMPQFMFSARPISAITKVNNRNFQSNTQDISESTMLMSMKGPFGQYQSVQHEGEQQQRDMRVQSPNVSAQIKASESMYWKNTRKYDNNTRSVKQFHTKQLLWNSNSDPRMINSSDLAFLKEDKTIHNTLEKSKLTAPKNHIFQEIARKKKAVRKENGVNGESSIYRGEEESQLDAKNSFNQSVSYINSLRTDLKISTSVLGDTMTKKHKMQRPMTAHPMISTVSPTGNQKIQLETVAEQVQESNKVYFSSLSDLRKKAFFLKLHSLEPAILNHPGLTTELKAIDWSSFKEISMRPDFQSIHLILIDLNNFDHGKYELEFQDNGSLKAKDKEGVREIADVHKEFIESTRTNIASMTIYCETASNQLLELFSRVLVYEEQENEYDLTVWRNIYRFVLHKIILANSPLYPDFKTYQDLARMIRDIIDDKKDYISPISSQIQLTKDHPIVVERNSHVYNFDFHSYIMECSSYYAQCINNKALQKPNLGDTSHRKDDSGKKIENLKQRPASAMTQKTKFPMFGTKQSQNVSRKESSNLVDPATFMSAKNMVTPLVISTTARHEVPGVDRSYNLAGYGAEQLIKLDPVRQNSDRKLNSSRSLRSVKKSSQQQDKFDMTLQGGRMDIYQDIKAAASTARSANFHGEYMSMTYGSGSNDFQRYFSSSAMQTPNQDARMFKMNPNGITVQYTKSPMKKSNVVIRKRPLSERKTPVLGHHSAVASNVGTVVNSGRGDNPYRFKF